MPCTHADMATLGTLQVLGKLISLYVVVSNRQDDGWTNCFETFVEQGSTVLGNHPIIRVSKREASGAWLTQSKVCEYVSDHRDLISKHTHPQTVLSL